MVDVFFFFFFFLKAGKPVSPPQDVTVDVVKLLVMENIMLQPASDVYIMVLSFLDYRVERKKYGKIEVVPLPSDQYRLEVTNVTVGRLDHQKSRVTGLVVGDTEVVLQDRSILTSVCVWVWVCVCACSMCVWA